MSRMSARVSARRRIAANVVIVAFLVPVAWSAAKSRNRMVGSLATETAAPLAYVGSETCVSCHQDEAKLWRGSHHELAMAHASEKTVFGDFSGADAMFAPVVNRLHVYDVDVSDGTRRYMDDLMALPAWKEWAAQAQAEPWVIDKYEIG